MIRKHILPLTYKPKIQDVLDGKITQTIRPISYTKPKNVGDLVMFHGWSGKPYGSKWSFRTSYWEIITSFDIHFEKHDGNIIIRKADRYFNFHTLSKKEMDLIAVLDGFKNIDDMFAEFYRMYGNEVYDIMFSVIRWKYAKKN